MNNPKLDRRRQYTCNVLRGVNLLNWFKMHKSDKKEVRAMMRDRCSYY